jgi:formate hydrogenlyase subunit 3/multisubunit Na+/H+ antiporter MnhD subunit
MVAAALGSVACVVLGLAVMVGPVVAVRFGSVLTYSLIDLRFDPLSGVFLVALGVVGAASSVYGLGYHEAGRSWFDTFALIAFIASLMLVFGSASAFSFLFA